MSDGGFSLAPSPSLPPSPLLSLLPFLLSPLLFSSLLFPSVPPPPPSSLPLAPVLAVLSRSHFLFVALTIACCLSLTHTLAVLPPPAFARVLLLSLLTSSCATVSLEASAEPSARRRPCSAATCCCSAATCSTSTRFSSMCNEVCSPCTSSKKSDGGFSPTLSSPRDRAPRVFAPVFALTLAVLPPPFNSPPCLSRTSPSSLFSHTHTHTHTFISARSQVRLIRK